MSLAVGLGLELGMEESMSQVPERKPCRAPTAPFCPEVMVCWNFLTQSDPEIEAWAWQRACGNRASQTPP